MAIPPPIQAGQMWNQAGHLNPAWDYWLRSLENVAGTDPAVIPDGTLADMLAMSPFKNAPAGAIEAAILALACVSRPRLQSGADADQIDLLSTLTTRASKPTRPQIVVCTQATFPATATLAPSTFVYVTDYCHMMFWDGVTMAFADGGNKYMALFETAPGTGWALYDGGTYAYLTPAGATANITLPDLTSVGALAAFLEAGGVVSGPTAASAPSISGSTAIGNAAFGAALTTTNSAAIAGNTGNDVTATQIVQAGVGATVPGEPHTHSIGTIADSGHAHLFTPSDTGHTHAVGTLAVSATGEPRKLIRLPYFRR